MIRHGARSHELKIKSQIPDGYFGEGVLPGYLTDKGRIQHQNIGLSRRNEYIKGKKFLSEIFDQHEILSMSTFK